MSRVITITGGKGGVGKTISTINLGFALNSIGKDVVVVDGNITTPNVGLYLGVNSVPISIHEVLAGSNIHDSIYVHESGTKIIPGNISLESLKGIGPDKLGNHIKKLQSDVVLIDCAAGLGRETIAAISASDEVLIVTNPEIPSVVDALKTAKVAESFGKDVIGVLLTKHKGEKEMSIEAVEELMGWPVIGVIPEDMKIKDALLLKKAVVESHPKSKSAVAYKRVANYLVGGVEEKKGFFTKLIQLFGK